MGFSLFKASIIIKIVFDKLSFTASYMYMSCVTNSAENSPSSIYTTLYSLF